MVLERFGVCALEMIYFAPSSQQCCPSVEHMLHMLMTYVISSFILVYVPKIVVLFARAFLTVARINYRL